VREATTSKREEAGGTGGGRRNVSSVIRCSLAVAPATPSSTPVARRIGATLRHLPVVMIDQLGIRRLTEQRNARNRSQRKAATIALIPAAARSTSTRTREALAVDVLRSVAEQLSDGERRCRERRRREARR